MRLAKNTIPAVERKKATSRGYVRIVALVLGLLLVGIFLCSVEVTTKAAETASVMNKAVSVADVARLQPEAKSNIANLETRTVPVPESPNSPAYFHIDKTHATVGPPIVPAGDRGALLKADLTAPATILYVDYDCHGGTCPWTYQCEARTCAGHSVPFEYHGDNTATWWGWTNDGNNSEYVFAIHYAAH